jgi:predicted ATPase
MFRRIAVQNFKSLADTETELGMFTVLAGENGAGKSSFLQAIEFASWAVRYESINEALQQHGIEFTDLVWMKSTRKEIRFEAQLEVNPGGSGSESELATLKMEFTKRRFVYLSAEGCAPSATANDPEASPYFLGAIKRSRAAREGSSEIAFEKNVALRHSLLREVWLSENRRQRFPVLGEVARHFAEFVHYEIWGPSQLRELSRRDSSLKKGGSGLPGLLDVIRSRSPSAWDELLIEIRRAYPTLKEIRFRRGIDSREVGMVFRESKNGHTTPLTYQASQMSDGFLRLLAVLAIKHQPEPLAVIGYEEPENGLHPSALDDCMRHLKDIARRGTQVIVTTHSPYLLNQILEDDAEPKAELRLVLRDKKGRTTIHAPDPEKVDRARRHGLGIGELWGLMLNEKDLAAK